MFPAYDDKIARERKTCINGVESVGKYAADEVFNRLYLSPDTLTSVITIRDAFRVFKHAFNLQFLKNTNSYQGDIPDFDIEIFKPSDFVDDETL